MFSFFLVAPFPQASGTLGAAEEREVHEKVNNRTVCSPGTQWCSAQTDTTASPQGARGAAARTRGAVPQSTVIIETEKTHL